MRISCQPVNTLVVVFLALLLLANGAPAATRTVLVLSGERAELPSIRDFERGLREGLADPLGATEIFVEYLDFGRFPARGDASVLVNHLRGRYGGQRIDALVTVVDAAFEFALENRANLFRGVPLVAAAVDGQSITGRALPDGVTSIPVVYDYRRTLALALALQPDARDAVVVHGVADFDLRRRDDARRTIEALAPRLQYRALGAMPLAAIEAAVRDLPRDSLVLLVSMVRDAEGRSLVGQDYAARLAAVSPVPIYGTFASHMRAGTVGGAISDYATIGRAAAGVVLRAFEGNVAARPIAVDTVDTPLRVNWRALERWGIDARRVPPDAQVLFREPRLWDAYRGLVIAAAAAVLLQALLISGLILQLRRRQRAEAGLRQSEETLRLTVEELPIAIVMVNPAGTIMFANSQAERLLGYNSGELRGLPAERLLPERFGGGHGAQREGFFSAPQAASMAVNRELSARRKDGSEIHVDIGLTPIRARDEQLVLAAIVDLSARQELRRKQQQLEHVSRFSTMGEIAASLAHELSQPLAAILANAQAGLRFIERGIADAAEIRAILQDVVVDDRRAGEVVGALRSMLRREESSAAPLDMAQVVRESLALLHGELVAQQVEAEAACAPGCVVRANKTQIEQILVNLVMNAIDAMRSQPAHERRLRIEVARAGATAVRVSVRDSGVGIPADEMDKVFEPFWTTKPAGMGMGLAIANTIVKSHGGGMQVAANAGRGVTFSFTLPLEPGQPPS